MKTQSHKTIKNVKFNIFSLIITKKPSEDHRDFEVACVYTKPAAHISNGAIAISRFHALKEAENWIPLMQSNLRETYGMVKACQKKPKLGGKRIYNNEMAGPGFEEIDYSKITLGREDISFEDDYGAKDD